MRSSLLIAAAVMVCFVASMPAPAAAQKAESLWAAITARPNLKAMSNFVTEDIKTALKNPKLASFTLLAPTDDAFYSMLNAQIPGIDIKSYMNNKAITTMVMNLHLVPGMYTTSSMNNGQKLQTRLGGESGLLTVQKSGSTVQLQAMGSDPKIVEADIMAGNSGVMHVIDKMLLPVRLPTVAGAGRR